MRMILTTTGVIVAAMGILAAGGILIPEERKLMKAQLTIYVAPPLLDTGGTVIVVANPIPLDQWQSLPGGANPARDDASNEKKKDLRPGDRLFGVVASSKVSIVEFVYPESGTFGFNFVALPAPSRSGRPLRTKQISTGDGGGGELENGSTRKWHYVSDIHVFGPEVSEAESRGVRVFSHEIMNSRPAQTSYEGVALHSPTEHQVDEAVLTSEELK